MQQIRALIPQKKHGIELMKIVLMLLMFFFKICVIKSCMFCN